METDRGSGGLGRPASAELVGALFETLYEGVHSETEQWVRMARELAACKAQMAQLQAINDGRHGDGQHESGLTDMLDSDQSQPVPTTAVSPLTDSSHRRRRRRVSQRPAKTGSGDGSTTEDARESQAPIRVD